MFLIALFGALLEFHRVPVPPNMASPQTASFQLAGFQIHERGRDTDTDQPQYLSETVQMRAAALIRFIAPADGVCNAYELSSTQDDGTVHRIGPLHVELNPNPDNTFPVKSGANIKAMVVLFNARDIARRALPLTAEHRTVGIECVRDGDGEIFYSELYRVDPEQFTAPTQT
jgi:hypothetical protein